MATITRTYSDIDLDFSAHPVTRDVLKKKDSAAVVASIFNLLQTSHYERKFNHGLGSGLRKMLFEPIDGITADTITTEIKNIIGGYEPRAGLDRLSVTPDYDNNGYNISLSFFLVNSTQPINVNFFLERIR